MENLIRRLLRRISPIERLERMPRNVPGHVDTGGYSLEYMDGKPLYYQYQEIVRERRYEFSKDRGPKRIIDCGANIGLASLFFDKTYPGSTIIAFEPNPEVLPYLYRNVAGHPGIRVIEAAVSDHDGTARLHLGESDAAQVASHGDVEVKIARLAPFLEHSIDFLKLDIEGHELPVLRDIAPSLGSVRALFIEYHAQEPGDRGLQEIYSILKKAGFAYTVVPQGKARPDSQIRNESGFYYQLAITAHRV